MKIVAISDTHNKHNQINLPEGDVLIISGDVTGRGKLHEIGSFFTWLNVQDFKYKILVAGNHDFCFEEPKQLMLEDMQGVKNLTYLEDEWIDIEGIKIYGTPYQPWFCDWAFNLPVGSTALKKKWEMIPSNIDILVTHCPAYNILDRTVDGTLTGCKLLKDELIRIQPKYHIFGHIHEAYGEMIVGNTTFINASICDENYKPVNAPIVLEI